MSGTNEQPDIDTPPNESTSLIPKPTPNPITWSEIEAQRKWSTAPAKSLFAECWQLLKDTLPVIFGYTLQMSLQTTTAIIIGQSSPMNLAVAAFAQMFALVTGWMIALGGTTALDTIASSTFTGSENKHDLGILLQRALFVLSLFFVPIAILWACSDPVFRALGQDPELSYLSSQYLTVLIPGGLGYIFFEVMKKYLQAQGKTLRFAATTLDKLLTMFLFDRTHESRNVRYVDRLTVPYRNDLCVLLYT